MIKYQSTDNKFKLMAVAALLVVLTAGLAWWWSGSRAVPEPGTSDQAQTTGGSMWPQAGVGDQPAQGPVATNSVLGDGRPGDVSEADWAVLLAVLSKMGQSPEDAAKLVGHVRYQRNFERIQSLSDPQDAAERRRLAQALKTELPERLKDGEFTLMEATFMGAALIAEIETDDARRNESLTDWQMQLAKLVPDFENDVAVAQLSRETQWKRLQATAYAEWIAQPDPSQRTQARLEQLMEQARREFNTGAP